MTRYIIAFLLIAFSLTARGQQQPLPPQANAAILLNKADNTQTLQRQQGLTNFLQAVANNLTNTTKNAQLKASIFALNWKDSVKKYASSYYLDHSWQRHTQVILGGGLDANNDFNSFTAGFSYDFLHKGDVTEVQTYNKNMDALYDRIGDMEANALRDFQTAKTGAFLSIIESRVSTMVKTKDIGDFDKDIIQTLVPTANRDSAFLEDKSFNKFYKLLKQQVRNSIDSGKQELPATDSSMYYLADLLVTQYYSQPLGQAFFAEVDSIVQNGMAPSATPANVDPLDFITFLAAVNKHLQEDSAGFHGKNVTDVYSFIQKEYAKSVAKIKLRPSLILGYSYTYNTGALQNQHTPYLTFLTGWGKASRPWEFSMTLSDSASTDTTHLSINHNRITLQPGFSKVFASDANSAALFETTLSLEYDRTTSSLYGTDKRDNYLPTLTFQARPTAKSPWIEIVVKRDMNHANFLGYLNVTFNLNNPSASQN